MMGRGVGWTDIGTAAEIETSDIDTCEFDTSGDSPSCAESHNRASEELGDAMHCSRRMNGQVKTVGVQL